MEQINIDPKIPYDVVTLPSQGIYYPNRPKSVRVSYLTASDENILSSPTLINSGELFKEILKRKILDKNFPVDDIVKEDFDAILIFLRNTAYGSTYSIQVEDPDTGKMFETEIDLSILKIKDFNLVENENGEYTYHMKKSNVDVTFKFLSAKDEKEIEEYLKSWNRTTVPPKVTKQLEYMIKSVNGNRDPMFIYNFIETLPIKDSQDFKKFIIENKPSLDLSQKVKTPSGDEINVNIVLGLDFFRVFYGL